MSRAHHRPPKTAVIVAQRIVSDIHRDGKKPGDRLAPERDMLEQYEIGRGTLRESLRFLELQGVITLKPGPGGGPIVQKPDASSLETTLTLQLQFEEAPFRAIVESRLGIEPYMARLAASRMSPELRKEFTESIEVMRTHLDDPAVFFEMNQQFHLMTAEGSGNALFHCTVDALIRLLDGTAVGIDYPARGRKVILQAHQAIHDAIIAEDADRSEALMRKHLEDYHRYLNKSHPEALEQPIVWQAY